MDTSWQKSSSWYKKAVGDEGHFFHQQVVLPNSLRLLHLQPDSTLLDLACGQGVLARTIPAIKSYTGFDLSSSLVKAAKKLNRHPNYDFFTADVTQSLPLKNAFSHAAIILALQNIDLPQAVIANAAKHLAPNGLFLIVLNHPCFRIPRQSSWEIDSANKIQYRRLNRYFSPLKIPIRTNPSLGERSPLTWSFHQPLSAYTQMLSQNGFVIKELEEWTSTKESLGKAAKMENRGREEFPLFLTLLCQKIN